MRFALGFAGGMALVTVAVALTARSAGAQVPPRPNIVYILADDLGYGEVGAYGQTQIRTPAIDRLAAEGLRFTQHYSGSPVCAPSRAALLTGFHTGHGYVRDNFELGGWRDDEERGQLPLLPGTVTLGRLLQQAGYATAVIGKWGLGGPQSAGIPTRQGFDYFFGYLDQKQAHNYYPTHLWRNDERVPLRNPYFSPHQRLVGDPNDPAAYASFTATDYAVDLMGDDALRWVRAHAGEPFFLYLAFPVPHLALQVPDEALAEYAGQFAETPYLGDRSYLPHRAPRAAYAAMITRMDWHIGRLMALLDSLGLDERTLVMFSSDNGPTYVGGVDTEFFRSTGGLRGLKGSVFEGGIRVPFIARWPGRIAPGSESAHVSAFWDVLPTVGALLGLEVPDGIDGRSFLPTLLGQPGQEEHASLYWEYHGLWKGAQAVRMGGWKGVRVGAHEHADAPIALFDLGRDPFEERDVSAAHPDVARRIAAVMAARTISGIAAWNFPAPRSP